jgi:FtsP/CotA-like multicopper oxidase with cupredoxin domain
MNIHIPLRRQALAGALVLALASACLPAPQPQPTAAPNLSFAPTLPPAATAAVPASNAPTAAPAATVGYTQPGSDLSALPDPLAGWQMGDRSVPITITEYGDFQ